MQRGAKNADTWWRGQNLNWRPFGYEPDELPDCSTPRRSTNISSLDSGFKRAIQVPFGTRVVVVVVEAEDWPLAASMAWPMLLTSCW